MSSSDNVSSDTDTDASLTTASPSPRKSRPDRRLKSRSLSDSSNQKSSSIRSSKGVKPKKSSNSSKRSARTNYKKKTVRTSKTNRKQKKSRSVSRNRSTSTKEKSTKSSGQNKSLKRAQKSKSESEFARSNRNSKNSKSSSRSRSISSMHIQKRLTSKARPTSSIFANRPIPKKFQKQALRSSKSRSESSKSYRSSKNRSSRSQSRSQSRSTSASTKSTRASQKKPSLKKVRRVTQSRSISYKTAPSRPIRTRSSRPSKTSRSRSSVLNRSKSFTKNSCPRRKKLNHKGHSGSRRGVKATIPIRKTLSVPSMKKNKEKEGRMKKTEKVTFAAGTGGRRKPLKLLIKRASFQRDVKSRRSISQPGENSVQIKGEKVLEMKTPFVVYNTTTVEVSPSTRQLLIQTAVLICDHDKTTLDETAQSKLVLEVNNEENGVLLEGSKVYMTRADGMILVQRTSIVNDFWERAEEVKTSHFQPLKFNVVRLNGSEKPSGVIQVHIMHEIRADKGQLSRREAVVINFGDDPIIHTEAERLKTLMKENRVVELADQKKRGFKFQELTLDGERTISVSREMGFTGDVWKTGKRIEKMEDIKVCCGGTDVPMEKCCSPNVSVQLSPEQMHQLVQMVGNQASTPQTLIAPLTTAASRTKRSNRAKASLSSTVPSTSTAKASKKGL